MNRTRTLLSLTQSLSGNELRLRRNARSGIDLHCMTTVRTHNFCKNILCLIVYTTRTLRAERVEDDGAEAETSGGLELSVYLTVFAAARTACATLSNWGLLTFTVSSSDEKVRDTHLLLRSQRKSS